MNVNPLRRLAELGLYYVEALVAPDSLNTMPPETFEAYRDHGDPRVKAVERKEELIHAAR